MPKILRSSRHKRLIAQLAEARKTQGMTQAQLAAAVGRPQSFVAKGVNGERRLEVLEFADLAAALGLNPGSFLNHIAQS